LLTLFLLGQFRFSAAFNCPSGLSEEWQFGHSLAELLLAAHWAAQSQLRRFGAMLNAKGMRRPVKGGGLGLPSRGAKWVSVMHGSTLGEAEARAPHDMQIAQPLWGSLSRMSRATLRLIETNPPPSRASHSHANRVFRRFVS
jgi:hypothetical protein